MPIACVSIVPTGMIPHTKVRKCT